MSKQLFLAVAVVLGGASCALAQGDRFAVVIGIDEYQALGKLSVCRNDAKALARVLVESGGYAESRVVLMTDDASEPQNRPTMLTLKRRIEQVASLAAKGDTLLVYFSGHGTTRGDQGYLVPMDGDEENALALAWLKDVLARSAAGSKVLILDACHAGSAAKGVGGIAPSLLAEAPGLVMLLSSGATQSSYPEEGGTHSIFSKHLAEGLAGAADANGDKLVTQAELYAYVRKQMTDWCLKTGKSQTPVALPEGAGGMTLAHLQPGAKPRVPRAAAPEKNIILDLGGGVTLPLTLVPAGKFVMGTPVGEPTTRVGDETQHEVTISKPFYMGVYEVTRGQFAAFVKDSGYTTDAEKEGWAYAWDGKEINKVSGAGWRNPGFAQTDMHPVVCVSWNDASAFCQWLSRKTGRAVRLPTEAEWEYACRAGTRTAYQWGDNPDDGKGWCNALDQTAKRQLPDSQVFSWEDGFVFTAPVGQFRPNAWGLYDMHGNVWEWCADWYGKYPSGAVTDPTGPGSGQDRVLRGGAWRGITWLCRCGSRLWGWPDALYVYGFRVVVPAAGEDLP